MRKTKIVCTIGPASESPEKLGYEFSHEYIAYEVASDRITH